MEKDRWIERRVDREAGRERQVARQTQEQRDGWTERQVDRETGRLREREMGGVRDGLTER